AVGPGGAGRNHPRRVVFTPGNPSRATAVGREPSSVCAALAQKAGGAGRADSRGTIEPSIAPTAPPMSAPAATAGAATDADPSTAPTTGITTSPAGRKGMPAMNPAMAPTIAPALERGEDSVLPTTAPIAASPTTFSAITSERAGSIPVVSRVSESPLSAASAL